jgi:hypothetical protein
MGRQGRHRNVSFLLTFIHKDVNIELTNINKHMDKYTKWYNNICKRGQNRVIEEYTEKHHIIPESFYSIRKRKGPSGWILGDSDSIENITYLTDREHELAHYLLTKIHKDNKQAYFKVLKAYEMRSMVNLNQEGKRYFSSRRLAGIRAERAKLQSESMKGNGNPQFGRVWTVEEKELQSKKLVGRVPPKKQIDNLIAALADRTSNGIKRAPYSEEYKLERSKMYTGEGNPRYGVEVSEVTRKRIGDKLRGRKQTDEEKLVRSLANMGSKREKKLCPHCGKHIAVNGYARFHGDRCKLKP